MPCFKGLAVSIHTPEGPIAEYSIQKYTRANRIACYIPVPEPKFTAGSTKPEQSTFAISITLLTPGAGVPYSKPKPTPEDPFPSQKIVGSLPSSSADRGTYSRAIAPYIPLTSSPNETIAAYIHFDGRTKEEVATLLRRGVETWVNSRWVSLPNSEGGGIAEREFLFREVGLERWLNGLDLKGDSKDVAARVQKRRLKLEKKRRKEMGDRNSDDEDKDDKDDNFGLWSWARTAKVRNGVLRYGDDKQAPIEELSDMSDSSSDSDDMPEPEMTGQIKVSLYRVIASGEVKRGEYSPQFTANDDQDEGGSQVDGADGGDGADVDHTTGFAQPKSLDKNSISTQTVTGIDSPNKPYATFTFFYRGKKQLQKMGILPDEPAEPAKSTTKRKSRQLDYSSLAPLKQKGTVGFSSYRDPDAKPHDNKNGKLKSDDVMDSDDDDAQPKTNGARRDHVDPVEEDTKDELSAEEAAKRGALAEGVKKMQLKRQLSFEPPPTPSPAARQASLTYSTDGVLEPPFEAPRPSASLHSRESEPLSQHLGMPASDASHLLGSPLKKQRATLSQGDPPSFLAEPSPLGESLSGILAGPLTGPRADILAQAEGRSRGSPTGSNSSTAVEPGSAGDSKEGSLSGLLGITPGHHDADESTKSNEGKDDGADAIVVDTP